LSVEAGAPVLPEPPPRLEPTTPSKPIGPVRSVFTLGSIKWTRNGEVCTAGRHITIKLPLDLVEMAIKNGYAIENTAVNAARIEDLRNLCPPDFASRLGTGVAQNRDHRAIALVREDGSEDRRVAMGIASTLAPAVIRARTTSTEFACAAK
jgi:hypothetical protein